ncbi:MAG: hypothetical protein NTW21_39285 [Verrucomicrobia bacterium]|nr:hypothetical protein [Verrucomicrobiota bacterium]
MHIVYILDTFPVLRRKELAAFGEFQSKRKALEEFERFGDSAESAMVESSSVNTSK